MEIAPDVRHFEYRTPRHPFSGILNVEIADSGRSRVIRVHGVDISVDGIALETNYQFDPKEPVTLIVPLWEHLVVGITGRLLYQSEDHCRFVFAFSSAAQCEQIQELIRRLPPRRCQ